MRTALKYYFKYVPKWYFMIQLIQTIIISLLTFGYGVLIPSTVAAFFDSTIEFHTVVNVFISFLLINIITQIIIKTLEYRMMPKLNYSFSKGINMIMFKKMNSVSFKYYDDSEFYDKFNLAKQNTLPAIYSAVGLIMNIIGQIISMGTMFALIALVDPVILLFMAGCVVISVIIQVIESIIYLKIQKESVSINHIFEYVSRTFYLKRYAIDQRYTNISDVNLNLYRNTIGRVEKLISKTIKQVMPLDCLDTGVTDILIYFSILIISCYRIAVLKEYSASELVAVLTSSISLFGRLSGIGNLLTQLYDIKKRIGFFEDFMSYPENHFSQGLEEKNVLSKEIIINDLSFSYGEIDVLHNISLRIPVGSTLALIGPNGAGKSTLIKILMGLYNEYSGTIMFDGIDSTNFSEQIFSDIFMVVNQFPHIYEMTIGENILLRPCETIEEKNLVWDLLQKVGLKDKVLQYKQGIDTVIGNEFHTDGIQLSGGELQKIAIARCLASKKKILIFDEPSSHLDPLSERELFESLLLLKNELTLIFITHNIHNIVDVDQIVWLENGMIEEKGTHEQLMTLNKKYAIAHDSLYNTLK